MNVTLRDALIASGQIKPQGADTPITGGVLLGLNGKPRLGDIRSTYMQNPIKTGHKKSEGKLTPPKKEKTIMSTASENKSESTTTNGNKGRGKAAESTEVAEIDMPLVMEAINKSHETNALLHSLVGLSQLESARSEALAHKVEAQSIRIDSLSRVVGRDLSAITDTVASLPKPKRDLVGDVGMLIGAITGGVTAYQLLKVTPAAEDAAVATQEGLGLTYAVSAGVGGMVGRGAAKVGQAAGQKIGSWYSKRKQAIAEVVHPKKEE